MRPIRLPEPPSCFLATPEIFEAAELTRSERSSSSATGSPELRTRASVWSAPSAWPTVTPYRVIRPRRAINECFRWLLVSLHKIVNSVKFWRVKVWCCEGRNLCHFLCKMVEVLACHLFLKPMPDRLHQLLARTLTRNLYMWLELSDVNGNSLLSTKLIVNGDWFDHSLV